MPLPSFPASPTTGSRCPRPPPWSQGGFSWISFSLCFCQPRVRFHRYAAAAVALAQVPALRTYCAVNYAAAEGRCLGHTFFKIVLLAALPYAAVHLLESKARRIFLLTRPEPLPPPPPSSSSSTLPGGVPM